MIIGRTGPSTGTERNPGPASARRRARGRAGGGGAGAADDHRARHAARDAPAAARAGVLRALPACRRRGRGGGARERAVSVSSLEILADLVAEPTVAGRSNLALIDALAERLSGVGAAVRVVESVREDARNLHAVLGPADAPGGILLAAHSDVVDVEGQPWTRDPFALALQDGRVYGRGSTDMKGFLAAALAALERDGLARRLRRPVHIALSSDEELGCRGVGPLLAA